ncbi:MAG: FKBP-type peptidyl-prolyl cis-trans isomerase [Bacteroidales bacterium]
MKHFKIIFLVLVAVFSGCKIQKSTTDTSMKTLDSGIEYRIVQQGQGSSIDKNDVVFAHYELRLEDGTVVDNSYNRGEPVYFKVGAGQVIKGWDQVFPLLTGGDKVLMRIPPELGYGDKAMGDIPPNATLIFNVEIMKVNKTPKPYDLAKDTEVKTIENGLKYSIIEEGSGKQLQYGMKVRIHYMGFLEDLTLFDSSYQREEPIEFVLGEGIVIKGWDMGIEKLKVGDKARFWIPHTYAYGIKGRGPIPPSTDLIFDVEVLDALEKPEAKPFNVSSADTIATPSGLKYLVVEEGKGPKPKEGQIAELHYSGYLDDGTLFDSSVERGQTLKFVMGAGQVIEGWEQGVALMSEGARYRLIVPADLAYGSQGIGPIPPDATLIFDVEIIDIE